MKGIKLKKDYFEKFDTNPIKIKPFNPKAKQAAQNYLLVLNKLLKSLNIEAHLKGSTLFEIAGKGEIEFAVYLNENNWNQAINLLVEHFKSTGNTDKNYARFNDKFEGFDIEIILLKGHEAIVDKKINEYLKTHPETLKEYEDIKRKYSYSKREYMIQKDKFFRKIIDKIPEE